jgi:predicted acylesterase/phospholipase RssA/CRP-like cAMP-binding protein
VIETYRPSAASVGATELLRGVPVLAELDESLLRGISAEVGLVSVAAGDWLFRAGDHARTAYVIASGRLEVVVEDPEEAVIGVLRRGSVIGELALLRGGRRAASIRAQRDSTLIALDRDQFEALMSGSPAFALALTRALAEQVASTGRSPTGGRQPRTFAVVALDQDTAAHRASEVLARELDGYGHAAFVSAPFGEHPEDWAWQLGGAEGGHDHVVLDAGSCDPRDDWTSFCLREADAIVAVSSGVPRPAWCEHAAALHDCELVILDAPAPDDLIDRLRPRIVRAVCGDAGVDKAMSELARRAAGQAVGVVLSGGGARAFAHLGVLEELRRAEVRIDRIGGVSLGAIVAAMVARGDDPALMRRLFTKYFVRQNPISDYTVPLVSLIRGRKTARLLVEEFSDARIESLDVPFFCTSTDLRRRELVTHRAGSVAHAVLASLSIPGVFPPARDRTGRLLVDGGVIDNLPVGAMPAGEGPVIAVDVTETTVIGGRSPGRAASSRARAAVRGAITGTRERLPPLAETIVRCMTFASADTVAAARKHADLVIAPEVSGIGLLDWQRLPEMHEAGVIAARRALAEHPELAARVVRS